ncbi:MAG: DUF1565 domain-containing protein [Phycisphaerae bacterium]|nr:DUF1565 domain-containing protein [Phycisphaerae bacterium]
MLRVAAAMMALLVCGVTTAATINVPADYTTIQAAVDAASNGDEILVAPGTYTGTGDEVVDTLGKAITIKASGTPEETIIDGEGARRVVQCAGGEGADTIIEGFTITGGSADYNGGGIYCYNSSPTITDCTISGNTADYGGGIYCNYYSSATITGCTISGNTATNSGGGIFCWGGSPTLTDTVVCENAPDNIFGSWTDGGGMCLAYSCQDSDGNGVPDKCDGSIGDGIHEVPSEYATVQEAINAAGYGDTVLVAPGTYTGTGDWVINPLGKPITIRATGTPEETILDGEGARGVVQCAGGEGADTIIEGFTITGGSADDNGGGIYCYNSSPTITDCTISDNTAAYYGGGINCNYYSSPTITDCTISGNTANDSGGGIYCYDSNPTITGCTISGNTAISGGGISCNYYSSPTLTDTVVCGNDPDQNNGSWIDNGGNTVSDECPICPDTNSDALVDRNDVLAVVAAWGSDDPDADVDSDGLVGVFDLLTVLTTWGPCE